MKNKLTYKHNTIIDYSFDEFGDCEIELYMIIMEIINGEVKKNMLQVSFKNKFDNWNFENARYFNLNWN